MVDVEQHALCSLEQDVFPIPACLVELAPHGPGEGQNKSRDFGEVASQARAVDCRLAEPGAAAHRGARKGGRAAGPDRQAGDVADTYRAATDLILISRADAAARGADLSRTRRVLAQSIEIAVDWQDQRAIVSHHQEVGRDLHSLLADSLHLALQRPRVEHHAIANDRGSYR